MHCPKPTQQTSEVCVSSVPIIYRRNNRAVVHCSQHDKRFTEPIQNQIMSETPPSSATTSRSCPHPCMLLPRLARLPRRCPTHILFSKAPFTPFPAHRAPGWALRDRWYLRNARPLARSFDSSVKIHSPEGLEYSPDAYLPLQRARQRATEICRVCLQNFHGSQEEDRSWCGS